MLKRRGFTLIELLVVIAVIGILSAITLASLSVARKKGADAAVMANFATIQTQLEIYYSNYGNYGSFTIVTGICTAGADDTSVLRKDTTIKTAIAAADAANGTGVVKCYVRTSDPIAYTIVGQLSVDNTKYWCIDNTGAAKQVDGIPADPDNPSCG